MVSDSLDEAAAWQRAVERRAALAQTWQRTPCPGRPGPLRWTICTYCLCLQDRALPWRPDWSRTSYLARPEWNLTPLLPPHLVSARLEGMQCPTTQIFETHSYRKPQCRTCNLIFSLSISLFLCLFKPYLFSFSYCDKC